MIELRVQGGKASAFALTTIKLAATRFPGEHELRLVIETDVCVCGHVRAMHPQEFDGRCWECGGGHRCDAFRPATRQLTLGPEWRYDASGPCMAALAEFGAATVR